LEKPPERAGIGGSEAFREAMNVQMRLAVAQARQVSAEAAEVKLPTFELRSDVWPPHFRAGSRVEFDPCTLEAVKLADFVVVQTSRGPAVRRFVRWRYEGDRVSLVVIHHPGTKETENLPGPSFLGVVVHVFRENRVAEPNKRGHLEEAVTFLTGCGTSGPIKEIRELVRDVFLVMESRKANKVRTKGFFESLRELREYHRKCEEEEARLKAESLAALKKQQELERLALSGSEPRMAGPQGSVGSRN
jgi:hypothetical protein